VRKRAIESERREQMHVSQRVGVNQERVGASEPERKKRREGRRASERASERARESRESECKRQRGNPRERGRGREKEYSLLLVWPDMLESGADCPAAEDADRQHESQGGGDSPGEVADYHRGPGCVVHHPADGCVGYDGDDGVGEGDVGEAGLV
jgi:hypothetical protein